MKYPNFDPTFNEKNLLGNHFDDLVSLYTLLWFSFWEMLTHSLLAHY